MFLSGICRFSNMKIIFVIPECFYQGSAVVVILRGVAESIDPATARRVTVEDT